MASIGNPRSWVPYMNSKDCSQGFCSLYCPQWCYIVYPPPPPFEFPEENSSPNFSPLVIAIIGILASAFLLVSYYTLISKYCGNTESSHVESHEPSNEEVEDNHNPSLHEPWHMTPTGLDEALIKTITVCQYKKGDGLVAVADCSVCLSELQEGESIRLLPKCSHAFHLPCIDTWLKSHSSCPFCRASIFTFNASGFQVSDSVMENNETSLHSHQHGNNDEEVDVATEEESRETARCRPVVPKPTLRALSDLGNLEGRHSVIEIRDEGWYEGIGRSVSMDHSFQSAANQVEDGGCEGGPSKRWRGECSGMNNRRRVLHCVVSPIAMKRSFSSGRFSLTRYARGGRRGLIPI